jgi:MoaA/NifB/PqqE/SkfB family radical SAM enzyme
VATFRAVKALALPNLSVGIHTVISRFNVEAIPSIYQTLRALNADSYITEIAEERVELDTVGANITPDSEHYAEAADYLVGQLKKERFKRLGRITRVFRMEYYKLVERTLRERRQVIPCYAGFASAHITPDGNVWMCCVRGESIGNLKSAEFRFREVWFGSKAEEQRKSIKAGECHCPLANAGYTNMLHSPVSLLRVLRNLAGV